MDISFDDRKVAKNAFWIVLGKVIQSLLGFVLSVLSARFLGLSNYGVINYAASLVSFVVPVGELGLSFNFVQNLVTYNDDGSVIGTSLVLSSVASFCSFIGLNTFVFLSNRENQTIFFVCLLYSTKLFFSVFELFRYWYQFKLYSKYDSFICVIAYVLTSIYKIAILFFQKDIQWFALVSSIDSMLIGISYVIVYRKIGGKRLHFSGSIAKDILSKCPHFILAGLTVSIFSNTDKIMIAHFLDSKAVGFYSLAFSLANMTGFFFSAIIDSFRPQILEAGKASDDLFEISLKRLYFIISCLSFFQAVFVFFFGQIVIKVLFGTDYSGAIDCLKIIAWYTTFSYIGAVNAIWIVAKNNQRFLLPQNIVGSLLNIILNLILIPSFGIEGAAVATLITQFSSNVLLFVIIPQLRPCFKLMGNSFSVGIIKSFFSK